MEEMEKRSPVCSRCMRELGGIAAMLDAGGRPRQTGEICSLCGERGLPAQRPVVLYKLRFGPARQIRDGWDDKADKPGYILSPPSAAVEYEKSGYRPYGAPQRAALGWNPPAEVLSVSTLALASGGLS